MHETGPADCLGFCCLNGASGHRAVFRAPDARLGKLVFGTFDKSGFSVAGSLVCIFCMAGVSESWRKKNSSTAPLCFERKRRRRRRFIPRLPHVRLRERRSWRRVDLVDKLQGMVQELQSSRASSPGASSPGGGGSVTMGRHFQPLTWWWEAGVRARCSPTLRRTSRSMQLACDPRGSHQALRQAAQVCQALAGLSTQPLSRQAAQQVFTKLKQHVWNARGCVKPIWVLIDKSPVQRILGRCVARTSSFLEQKLGLGHEVMEVASWNGAFGLASRTRESWDPFRLTTPWTTAQLMHMQNGLRSIL